MITYQLQISGQVQGVWFRESAKEKAIALGVKGQIWNEANGDVTAIIQGEPEALDLFVLWCRTGPPLARVEQVKVTPITPEEEFDSFTVVRHP